MKSRAITIVAGLLMTITFSSVAEESLLVRSQESQNGQALGTAQKSYVGNEAQPLAAKSTADKHSIKQKAAPLQRSQDAVRTEHPDFWIFDAHVELIQDNDFDGYYSTFSLEFDADTVFADADVYARIYLSRGDIFEEYHTTSIFSIQGDSSFDSLVVDSELVTGFPPGDYEILIELYDAYDDTLVTVFDGYNDADLTYLTLESKSFEVRETVVIVEEHGGSLAYLMLLIVPVLFRRRFKQA